MIADNIHEKMHANMFQFVISVSFVAFLLFYGDLAFLSCLFSASPIYLRKSSGFKSSNHQSKPPTKGYQICSGSEPFHAAAMLLLISRLAVAMSACEETSLLQAKSHVRTGESASGEVSPCFVASSPVQQAHHDKAPFLGDPFWHCIKNCRKMRRLRRVEEQVSCLFFFVYC